MHGEIATSQAPRNDINLGGVLPNKKATIASTQKYLNILAIRDGMVVLHDGGIRIILEVGSLNFALKSEDEQNGIVYSYQQFLNSLKYPIQVVMQSRRLDLYGYLKMLRELLEKQTNDLIRIQTEEYINFIEKLLTKANIMDKTFYVVVSYFPSGIEKMTMLDKVLGGGGKSGEVHYTKDQFEEFKTELQERVNVISAGLGSMGLRVQPLNTQEIIELLYGIYNPAEAISERMTEVSNLESDIVKTDMPVQVIGEDKKDDVESEGKTSESPEVAAPGAINPVQEQKDEQKVDEILEDLPVVMNTVPEVEISDATTPGVIDNNPSVDGIKDADSVATVPDQSAVPGQEIPQPQTGDLPEAQAPVDGITQSDQPIDENVQVVDPLSQNNPVARENSQSSQPGNNSTVSQ